MKIVHVEDFFHPDAGYQINILSKFMQYYGHDVTIITSELNKVPKYLTSFFDIDDVEKKDKIFNDLYKVKIIRLKILAYISGRAIFKGNIFNVIDKLNPDIVYVHGNDTLTGIRFLLRYSKLKYPIVMDSHMLEMASKNKFKKLFRWFYKLFITPIIIKNKIPVIRTQNDLYLVDKLGVPLNLSPWISVGSDTLLFYKNEYIRNIFRKNNNIGVDDFVVIYAGKMDESKGGLTLALAFKDKFETNKNIVLIVVGNLSMNEYGKKLGNIFLNSFNRIIRFNTQKYTDLPIFFTSADLCVFPKQCSLTFYDAQACGLPIVAESNNVNIERLSYGNGYVFDSGNIEDFRNKILRVINMSKDKYLNMSNNSLINVKQNYDYKKISLKYIDILLNEFSRFHKGDTLND